MHATYPWDAVLQVVQMAFRFGRSKYSAMASSAFMEIRWALRERAGLWQYSARKRLPEWEESCWPETAGQRIEMLNGQW
jgi:hypothetical protein